jgi:hypothetical protein
MTVAQFIGRVLMTQPRCTSLWTTASERRQVGANPARLLRCTFVRQRDTERIAAAVPKNCGQAARGDGSAPFLLAQGEGASAGARRMTPPCGPACRRGPLGQLSSQSNAQGTRRATASPAPRSTIATSKRTCPQVERSALKLRRRGYFHGARSWSIPFDAAQGVGNAVRQASSPWAFAPAIRSHGFHAGDRTVRRCPGCGRTHIRPP